MSHLGHPSALKCHDCSKNILDKEILLKPGVLNSLHICEKKRAFNTRSTVNISGSGDGKQSLTINVRFTRKKQEGQRRLVPATVLSRKRQFHPWSLIFLSVPAGTTPV